MIEPYYTDSHVTIYNADCRDVLPQLGRFDLMLTDPPYGILSSNGKKNGKSSGAGKLRNRTLNTKHIDWDDSAPSLEMLNQLIRQSELCVLWGATILHCHHVAAFSFGINANRGPTFLRLRLHGQILIGQQHFSSMTKAE